MRRKRTQHDETAGGDYPDFYFEEGSSSILVEEILLGLPTLSEQAPVICENPILCAESEEPETVRLLCCACNNS